MDAVLPGSASRSASIRDCASSVSALFVGPRFEPEDPAAL